jgi:hypothetical protein
VENLWLADPQSRKFFEKFIGKIPGEMRKDYREWGLPFAA